MNNVIAHPIKDAQATWDKMVSDEWYLLDDSEISYAEIGDPDGPSEDYHVITITTNDTLIDRTISMAYFSDGLEMPWSLKPEVPLMRSWNAKPLPDLDFYDVQYPEWSRYFFRAIDLGRGLNMQIRAYRRMEQWGISFNDEIGKQRIVKDVDDAYRRLFPNGRW